MNKERIKAFYQRKIDEYLSQFDDTVVFGSPVASYTNQIPDTGIYRTIDLNVSAVAEKRSNTL